MQINKKVLQDFYKNKIPPQFKDKKVQDLTAVILTLIAFSLFGIFAISPTLSTIAQLQKQLEDNKFINDQLEKKITNLGILQQKYNFLQDDLQVVYAAIPEKSTIPFFVGQIQNLAQEANVALSGLQTSELELSKTEEGLQEYSSFNFSLEVQGSYENVLDFLSNLANFERIADFDAVSINKNSEKTSEFKLNIKGKAYFKI